MLAILKDAWSGLSMTGRAVVIVVLALAAAGLIALAMWLRYDMSWLPALLGKAVE
jgi:hypothetical protein